MHTKIVSKFIQILELKREIYALYREEDGELSATPVIAIGLRDDGEMIPLEFCDDLAGPMYEPLSNCVGYHYGLLPSDIEIMPLNNVAREYIARKKNNSA